MEKLQIYLKESYEELVHNVTWPKWASLQGNAVAVIIASLILALLVFVMDVLAKTGLDLIYGI
jgi:preprotein translocase subunit SecE